MRKYKITPPELLNMYKNNRKKMRNEEFNYLQRSYFGLLCFLLFINDITDVTDCN